ncbi:META domain-containing protein [Nocardioides daphniae]|uniref:META domain-containing protein n=1 Tax=Nocardioides daphniae TaxID=402297 RepID=A0A4P7UCX7_9ACTN|nr:META domain-containing protein [Nocardioides daphniae]QCC78063.1 META domain-containing protein [Nocardioides daphniae]GGD22548.1 hypothetical protein GCM10007231_22020 [Nocardioides daphniae]
MVRRRGTAAVVAVMLGATLAGCGQDAETDPENLTGSWVLVEFQDGNASDPLIETTVTLKDGRVAGNGGVNELTGGFKAEEGGKVTFDKVSTSRKAGPLDAADQEDRFLASLGKVAAFEVDEGDDGDRTELELKNSVGVTLLSFVEAP